MLVKSSRKVPKSRKKNATFGLAKCSKKLNAVKLYSYKLKVTKSWQNLNVIL